MSGSTLTHDGTNGTTDFFQDASFDFDAQGIEIGDVIYNTSDGGSLAIVRAFASSGGANSNDKLMVDSIDGGTTNDYTTDDVVQIWDRYAQKAFDGTRFTDTDIDDAITQVHSIVATRFGGVEASDLTTNIESCSRIELVNVSTTAYTRGETITGGTNGHTVVCEYVGTDFLIVRNHIAKVNVDSVSGTFLVGETVTGSTNSYTGRVEEVNAAYLRLSAFTGTFADNETLTGGTSGATCLVDEASGYGGGLFALAETLTGGTSGATGQVKATYTRGNYMCMFSVPTDLKNVVSIRYWDGTDWTPMRLKYIQEHDINPISSGDPLTAAKWEDKFWIWPSTSVQKYDGLNITYIKWPNIPSAAASSTEMMRYFDRLLVLESALILSRRMEDNDRTSGILNEIARIDRDVFSRDEEDASHVRNTLDLNAYYGDEVLGW